MGYNAAHVIIGDQSENKISSAQQSIAYMHRRCLHEHRRCVADVSPMCLGHV